MEAADKHTFMALCTLFHFFMRKKRDFNFDLEKIYKGRAPQKKASLALMRFHS